MTAAPKPQKQKTDPTAEAIELLIEIMDQTHPDADPLKFLPSNIDQELIIALSASYNALQERMNSSLRRSRQFAADVTHELRTPLTILRGETELALRGERSAPELRGVLESNLEEISRMSVLIEDLLLLSKSDLGEIPLKKEPLLVQELAIDLHHQAQLLSASKQIKVSLQVPEEEIYICADTLRLRQVFLNLISNAIKYTPENGNVTIGINLTDQQQVTISISDTGIGIPEAEQNLIFERFYRVDKTRNRNDGGSGLGLSIVKWIVSSHEGTIAVNSSPGAGSCFSVTLPVSA